MIGGGHGSPPLVDDLDRNDAEIPAIGAQRFAIGLEHDACGSARRLPPRRPDQLAIAIAAGFQHARLVLHLPLSMSVAWHGTPTEAATVQQQLDAIEIGVTPHVDLLARLPVPMRQEMQHGLRAPLRLIVVIVVLGKSARVHDPEVRADARPTIERRRLAAVVEPGPDESAGDVGSIRHVRPPGLRGRGPPWMIGVVRGYVALRIVAAIDAARADRTAGLAAENRQIGKPLVERFHLIGAVVEAEHIDDLRDPGAEALIHRVHARTRRVELPDELLHRACHASAALSRLVRLLVAE